MPTTRKDPLISGEIYHVFNKSIADYKIFNTPNDFERIKQAMIYYQSPQKTSLSVFTRQHEIIPSLKNNSVKILAYCIMPTHFHLILKQVTERGISQYLSNISNSYTRYFNTKHNRRGPLWQNAFKNVLVETDAQLLHLTRYIHLNPVTSHLVEKPEEWKCSSYKEYLNLEKTKFCNFSDLINVKPKDYKEFVRDRVDYQRELQEIKHQIIE